MLYLVGENIDKNQAYYLHSHERIKRIGRGIYVNANDDPGTECRAHALRLVYFLVPDYHLMGRSALRRAPDDDGTLLLGGSRFYRRELPGLTLVGRVAENTLGKRITLNEGASVELSALPQALLESYHFTGADPDEELLRQALEGLDEATYHKMEMLARRRGWEKALARFHTAFNNLSVANVAGEHEVRANVFWHGRKAGELSYDGLSWRYNPETGFLVPLTSGRGQPGELDPQFESLLPEGWLTGVLDGDERRLFSRPQRLLTNIETGEAPSGILERILPGGELKRWRRDATFTGHFPDIRASRLDELNNALSRLYRESERMPVMSGAQVKMPMSLGADGFLEPAVGRGFTHIWKPPGAGNGGWRTIGAVEWFGQNLTQAAGVDAADTALAPHRHDMPPGLLVERFDIRHPGEEQDWILASDMACIMGVAARDKYKPSVEKVAKAVMTHTTDPEADGETLMRQFVAAWVMGNGDLHVKNLTMVHRSADPARERWDSIRLSPAYDMLCTRVFADLEHDQMALTLGGKRDNYKPAQWRALGRICGVSRAHSDALVEEVASRMAVFAETALDSPPGPVARSEECLASLEKVKAIIDQRAQYLGVRPDSGEKTGLELK